MDNFITARILAGAAAAISIDDSTQWGEVHYLAPTGSRLQANVYGFIVFATVIADLNKLKGMTIGSISDYLAVLTLTQTRLLDDCSQLPSIMDLLAWGCSGDRKSDALTAGDLAYLRALYSVELNRPLALERSNPANAMFRQFRQGH